MGNQTFTSHLMNCVLVLYWCTPVPPPSSSMAVKQTCLQTLKNRIQAFETKCLMNLLRISYLEHKTNDWVRSKISFLVGLHEHLLVTFKRWKLAWLGHVTRHNSHSKTIFWGT